MLRWPIAAKAPSTIDAMETNTTICCHSCGDARKRHNGRARENGDAGDFGRGGKKCRDRRRRALVDVGGPHVERHRGNLEAEPGEQEDQAEDQPDTGAALRRLGDAGKIDGAGESINQRGAIEQHSGRQRAQHEIFQAGFGRSQVVTIGGRDHVERQAHQLETQIERNKIRGRDQHQHAERREQEQRTIFEFLLLFESEIIKRQQECTAGTDQREHFQKSRILVDQETSAKHRVRTRWNPERERRRPPAAR